MVDLGNLAGLHRRWNLCRDRLQTKASDDTYAEIKKQTAASQQSATDADNTFGEITKQTLLMRQQTVGMLAASVITESPRPFPFPKDVDSLRHQSLILYFANVGKVKSGRFEASATLTRKSIPNFKSVGQIQQRSLSVDQLPPLDQWPVGIPGFRTDDVHMGFSTDIFTEKEGIALASFGEIVELAGISKYDDGFGNMIVHHFVLCMLPSLDIHLSKREAVRVAGKAVGASVMT